MEEAGATLTRLTPADLEATYEIQGYTVTGLYAIFHAVEHFAMHYGQIAYIVKSLQNRDLGFWSALDKTGRAKWVEAFRETHAQAAQSPFMRVSSPGT